MHKGQATSHKQEDVSERHKSSKAASFPRPPLHPGWQLGQLRLSHARHLSSLLAKRGRRRKPKVINDSLSNTVESACTDTPQASPRAPAPRLPALLYTHTTYCDLLLLEAWFLFGLGIGQDSLHALMTPAKRQRQQQWIFIKNPSHLGGSTAE